MKNYGFKYQIIQLLNSNGWVISEIDKLNEWWDSEHWKVEYEFNSEIYFYIFFLIDPMQENRIWQIKATNEIIKSWDEEKEITSICMSKRNFNKKLIEFIKELEKFKKTNA